MHEACVLGADQVLVCEGRMLNKVLTEAEARETLLALAGREHQLISAAVIARGGAVLWRRTEVATLRMRQLSKEFLDRYLAAEMPDILGSVGCYRIEGRGVQLFTEVLGDQFCIRGLPLLAVLAALRDLGVVSA
jgi:septum formation protein